MNVFMRKKQDDSKKSILKVLDFKKDYQQRIKHLRFVVDTCEDAEIYTFFNGNLTHSHIYTLFFEAFCHVEISLKNKDRITRQHREELDNVLHIFEKILIYLPELIHQRWQVNSIGFVMGKLLHPGNSLRYRKNAMRLFILWYQILGEAASEIHHATFATLVPGFHYRGSSSVRPLTDPSYGSGSKTSGLVVPGESGPMMPSQLSADAMPSQLGTMCLDYLLNFLVTEKSRIYWGENRDTRSEECFYFLFEMFKKNYLVQLFPKFSWKTNLYDPVFDLPEVYMVGGSGGSPRRGFIDNFAPASPNLLFEHSLAEFLEEMQVTFINWLCAYVHSGVSETAMKPGRPSLAPPPVLMRAHSLAPPPPSDDHSETSSTSSSQAPSSSPLLSKASSVSQQFHFPPPAPPYSQPSSWCDFHNSSQYVSVRRVLFSTRENVNLIHEIFRQAFLFGPCQFQAIRLVISVYRDWIMLYETPTFLLEPIGPSVDMSGVREEVRAGLQKTLQLFILHSCSVFLAEMPLFRPDFLDHQEELCKRVLNNYRYMVMNTPMSSRTWELLLQTLLHLISGTLKEKPPPQKRDSLGGRLAAALLQTLLVTWIRANLNVAVSVDLWDQLLTLLSSLVEWSELIEEWGRTMETLTRVLAKHVYGLDMDSLPLDRMHELASRRRQARISQQGKNPAPAPRGLWTRGSEGKGAAVEKKRAPPQPSPSTARNGQQQDGVRQPNHPSLTSTSSGGGDAAMEPLCGGNGGVMRRSRVSAFRPSVSSSLGATGSRIRRSVSDCTLDDKEYRDTVQRRRVLSRRVSRSMETLRTNEETSRSSSPSPSSGQDSASIKDAPMQIDLMSAATDRDDSLVSLGDPFDGARSVMAGGSLTGWHPDATVVLWRRMLGILGNINAISNTELHARAFEVLRTVTEALMRMRDNLGVSEDNVRTPPAPMLVPPISFVAPWCFKAIDLPSKYQRGRLIAYSLLCKITLQRQQDVPLSREHFIKFYHVLHFGLASEELDVVNALVKACGPTYLSLGLPGSSLLLFDFIQASSSIASSTEFKGVPRTEALSILSVVLSLPPPFRQVPLLHPSRAQIQLFQNTDVKDVVLSILLKSGRKEPAGLSRCIALCALGLYIQEEVRAKRAHSKLREAIGTLLFALKITTPAVARQSGLHSQFQAKNVAQVAADLCLLMAEFALEMEEILPDIVTLILEALCTTLQTMSTIGGGSSASNSTDMSAPERHLATTVLLALGEWAWRLSPIYLLQPQGSRPAPLLLVLKAILTMGECDSSVVSLTVPESPRSANRPPPGSAASSFQESPGTQRQRPPSFLAGSQAPPPLPTASVSLRAPLGGNKRGVATAAKTVAQLLLSHVSHFPLGLGASHLGSIVLEPDDTAFGGRPAQSELHSALFASPALQFLLLNQSSVLSVIQLPSSEPVRKRGESLRKGPRVRIITRDQCGKFAWDVFSLDDGEYRTVAMPGYYSNPAPLHSHHQTLSTSSQQGNSGAGSSIERKPSLSYSNPREGKDAFESFLDRLGHESPECLLGGESPTLASPSPPPKGISPDVEEEVLTNVLNQKTLLLEYLSRKKYSSGIGSSIHSGDSQQEDARKLEFHQGASFDAGRAFLAQFGLLSWEMRSGVELVRKNEGFLRQLRNLDLMRGREKHKIAVIYVGPGQEDKHSILSNTGGSQAYEDFVAGLGWEVDLETHAGFMGGLQKNKSTGESAPYYATPLTEIIFHVSTRMSHHDGDQEGSILQKTRHLGNDEVHIIWSEHSRDYRRGIIPTEFCDVLIGLYPLENGLIRVQITRKPEVHFFGPLFDGVLLPLSRLPGLVRATAINASRAIKAASGNFVPFYMEREKALTDLIDQHLLQASFEGFASQVFSPIDLPYLHPNHT